MAMKPHGREVNNILDDGSTPRASQPAELEAQGIKPQGKPITEKASSCQVAEHQRLEDKIQELLKDLSKKRVHRQAGNFTVRKWERSF